MRAAVRLVVLVGAQMLREVAFKVLIANLAVERFNIPMQTTQVFLECVPSIKRFAAQIANVIAFVQVTFHVQF